MLYPWCIKFMDKILSKSSSISTLFCSVQLYFLKSLKLVIHCSIAQHVAYTLNWVLAAIWHVVFVCMFSVKLQLLLVELNYYSFPMFQLNENSVSHSSFTLTSFTVSLVFDARQAKVPSSFFPFPPIFKKLPAMYPLSWDFLSAPWLLVQYVSLLFKLLPTFHNHRTKNNDSQ